MPNQRSHALPLFVSLLICISVAIVSHSLDYRVRSLQERCDEVEVYYQLQFQELAVLAAESDIALLNRQSQIIQEVSRQKHNQDLLIQQSITEATPEESE